MNVRSVFCSQFGRDLGFVIVAAGLPFAGSDYVREAEQKPGTNIEHAGYNGVAETGRATSAADQAERIRFHVQKVQREFSKHRQPRGSQRLTGQKR